MNDLARHPPGAAPVSAQRTQHLRSAARTDSCARALPRSRTPCACTSTASRSPDSRPRSSSSPPLPRPFRRPEQHRPAQAPLRVAWVDHLRPETLRDHSVHGRAVLRLLAHVRAAIIGPSPASRATRSAAARGCSTSGRASSKYGRPASCSRPTHCPRPAGLSRLTRSRAVLCVCARNTPAEGFNRCSLSLA